MTRTIPEIRQRLYEIAIELNALADETRREFHGRRVPTTSKAMTTERTEAIREYAGAHPERSEHEIAVLFGVNQGRVSEALFGKRGER